MSTQFHIVDGIRYRTDVAQAKGPSRRFVYLRAVAFELAGEKVAEIAGVPIYAAETLSVPVNAMGDMSQKVESLRMRTLDLCVAHRAAAVQFAALRIPVEADVRKSYGVTLTPPVRQVR